MRRATPSRKAVRKPAKRLARRKNPPSQVERLLALDQRESAQRLKAKEKASIAKWGKNWRDTVRSGRVFTRVQRIEPVTAEQVVTFVIREEPGWEWNCQNCHTRSLVTESMIAIYTIKGTTYRDDVLKDWERLAAQTAKAGFKPPMKPTAATANCPNCKFKPGEPE